MKINAVISKPSVNINSADKSAAISTLVIAIGIIAGVILFICSENSITDTLFRYFISFSTDFTNKNKPEILSGIILSNLPYLVMMLIFGTSAIGTPCALILTTIKSMGIGMLTTYIYDAFSLKGIEYCLLILFPGKFILIFSMILLTQSCIITSSGIKNNLKSAGDRAVLFDKFILRSVFILLLFTISTIIDFTVLISFSSLFDFT